MVLVWDGKLWSINVRKLLHRRLTDNCSQLRSMELRITALMAEQTPRSSTLTYRFVCHAHVSRSPSTKSTGQVVGFLHGGFGWVIWKLCGDAGGPGRKSVHAPRTVKAVGTSVTWQTQPFIQLILTSTYYGLDFGLVQGLLNFFYFWEVFHIISRIFFCKTSIQIKHLLLISQEKLKNNLLLYM